MLFKSIIVVLLLVIICFLIKLLIKKRYTYLDYTAYYTNDGEASSLRNYVISYRDSFKDGIQFDTVTGNFTNPRWMCAQHIHSKNEAYRQERIRKFFNKH